MTQDSTLRIGVLHRHRLLRESLSAYLDHCDHLSVVYSAEAEEAACRALCLCDPQVALVQWDQMGENGLVLAKLIRAGTTDAKIIMMGVPDRDAAILSCIETAGASAYLLEDASLHDVVQLLDAVARNETICSPRIARLLFSRVSTLAQQQDAACSEDEAGLTPRERQVVCLIEQGLCNKEIAVALRIEVQTVKNHVHNILDKLDVQDRQAAARYARERGLVAH